MALLMRVRDGRRRLMKKVGRLKMELWQRWGLHGLPRDLLGIHLCSGLGHRGRLCVVGGLGTRKSGAQGLLLMLGSLGRMSIVAVCRMRLTERKREMRALLRLGLIVVLLMNLLQP